MDAQLFTSRVSRKKHPLVWPASPWVLLIVQSSRLTGIIPFWHAVSTASRGPSLHGAQQKAHPCTRVRLSEQQLTSSCLILTITCWVSCYHPYCTGIEAEVIELSFLCGSRNGMFLFHCLQICLPSLTLKVSFQWSLFGQCCPLGIHYHDTLWLYDCWSRGSMLPGGKENSFLHFCNSCAWKERWMKNVQWAQISTPSSLEL